MTWLWSKSSRWSILVKWTSLIFHLTSNSATLFWKWRQRAITQLFLQQIQTNKVFPMADLIFCMNLHWLISSKLFCCLYIFAWIIVLIRWNTFVVDTDTFFVFSLSLERLYGDQLTTTFFQTFILWILAYLTLFIPVRNLNERFMGAVTALLVLASLLGTMEDRLPKSSQMKFIDICFKS